MKILVVEDSSSERIFLRRYLGNQGHEVITAADGASAVRMYGEGNPDLVLLDFGLPDMDGRETVKQLRASTNAWVPIIFLSGKDGTDDIQAALDAGGDDYLVKPFQPKILEAKLRSMGRIAAMRQELVEANEKLRRLAEIDGLTGVANRMQLDKKLADEYSRCARSQQPLSVILLDIDHFKRFNDIYGHATGDVCLKLVAGTIAEAVKRPADLASRYGGEEFCIVLPETSLEGAIALAEDLRAKVAGLRLDTPGGVTTVTVSLGVDCRIPTAEESPAHMLHRADQALYKAKAAGRNAVQAAGPDL